MANALGALYRWAIPAAIGAAIIQNSLYDVKGGTRGVIFDRLSGVKEDVVNEGTHFLIPWLQKAIIYDVRTKPRNISTTTGSKDLQMVSLTLRVLHRPEVKMLPKIYQVCLHPLDADFNSLPLLIQYRTSAKITTNVFFHPLATKFSKPSSLNLTPPNSSPKGKLSPNASARIFSSEPKNSTSSSKTYPSRT